MPFDGRSTEALLEALEKLTRQSNFRKHDEGLLARFKRARDGFEIDFRLAGAGHAVEQGYGEIFGVYSADKRCDGARLLVRKARRRMSRFRTRKDALRNGDFD